MKALLSHLTTWALGPPCPFCNQRQRGDRTLARHVYVDHGDERPIVVVPRDPDYVERDT